MVVVADGMVVDIIIQSMFLPLLRIASWSFIRIDYKLRSHKTVSPVKRFSGFGIQTALLTYSQMI